MLQALCGFGGRFFADIHGRILWVIKVRLVKSRICDLKQ